MKKSHRKGVASHPDPESCAVSRKAEREALTSVRAGRVSRRETNNTGVPTSSAETEGHADGSANVSVRRTLRGQRPVGFAESPRARTGRAHQHPTRCGMLPGWRSASADAIMRSDAGAGDRRQGLRRQSVAKAVAAAGHHRTYLSAQEETCSVGDAGWSRAQHRLAGQPPALGGVLGPLAPNLPGVLSYLLLHDRLANGCAMAPRHLGCVGAPSDLLWTYRSVRRSSPTPLSRMYRTRSRNSGTNGV